MRSLLKKNALIALITTITILCFDLSKTPALAHVDENLNNHYFQAIIKYISTHGLKTALTQDRAFGNMVKMLIALALLPAGDVQAGLAIAKRNIESAGLSEQFEPVMQ